MDSDLSQRLASTSVGFFITVAAPLHLLLEILRRINEFLLPDHGGKLWELAQEK